MNSSTEPRTHGEIFGDWLVGDYGYAHAVMFGLLLINGGAYAGANGLYPLFEPVLYVLGGGYLALGLRNLVIERRNG